MEDFKVVACNYLEGSGIASPGALAYLVGGSNGDGFERRIFLVRSRGGRWVKKWERTDRMTNYRLKTMPPEHPLAARIYDLTLGWPLETPPGLLKDEV